MSTKSAVKSQPEALRSPAEIAAARDEQVSKQRDHQAEYEKLHDELPGATLAGVEALAAHEQKMDLARRNAAVAGARAEEFGRLHDEAVQRESDNGIRARHRLAQSEAAKLQAEIEGAYERLKQVFDVLCREKALDNEIAAINRLIGEHQPEGLIMLPSVEAWRREPAIPVEHLVREISVGAGSADVRMLKTAPGEGEDKKPTGTMRQTLITGGASEYRPAPLYDTFAVPGLKRGDPNLIVPGSSAFRWWPHW